MWVRDATPEDTAALAGIFYRAVQIGSAEVYTQDQRNAWAGQPPNALAWAKRIEGLLTLVADAGRGPIGFMSLRMDDGYLDLAFVEPVQRGLGVAKDIYIVLENRARAAGLTRLTTHASHMAKPFLERCNWQTLHANRVECGEVTLDNWVMEKRIS